MRASLMALDKIYHHHGIMPGAVRSSPVFDNASRALQRLTLDNEAAAAVATADWQVMEQVLEVARQQNNQVVASRMEVHLVVSLLLLCLHTAHISHLQSHVQSHVLGMSSGEWYALNASLPVSWHCSWSWFCSGTCRLLAASCVQKISEPSSCAFSC